GGESGGLFGLCDRHRGRLGGALGDGAGSAADGHHSRLDQLADADGLEHGEEVLELRGVAGHLDRDGLGGDVDDLRLEELDGVEHLAAGLVVSPDLDHQQLATHRCGPVELDDLDDLDQLVELLGDLLERQALNLDDDGHARDVGLLGGTDGQAVDVEPATAEQRRDPGQDPRVVLHQDGESVLAHQRSSSSYWGAMSRAYWISSLLVPAATIGHTIESRLTRKST